MDLNIMENSFCSAAQYSRALEQSEKERMQQDLNEGRKIAAQNAPIIEQLQQLQQRTEEQNNFLSEQIVLLKEENERQKQQLIKTMQSEQEAKKIAKKSHRFSVISFLVSTAIALASLTVAVVASLK